MEVRVRVPDGFENVHAQRHDRFLVELATDRESYAAGDSVRVQYRLVNTSGGSVRLMFPSGQRYDLALDGPQGRVWQWSATRSFIQVLSAQVLDAEETFEFTEVFSLSEIGAGSGDSFLLRGFLSVAPDEDGSARPSETEGLVKFAVGSQVGGGLPQSGPDGRVAIEVALDQDGYSVEGSVQVTYRLTNISEEVLRLTFPSGQRYDLVLEGNEGPFWGWSRTRLFVAEISEQTLAPKESFEFQEVIPLTEVAVQDGGYALKVFLAVRSDSEMGLTQDETTAWARFQIGTGLSHGGPLPPVETPTDVVKQDTGRLGDFNGDGLINFADFLRFAAAFGKRLEATESEAVFDLDNDAEIGFQDFLIFASVFGK
jgi:hypothetical protein